jgi:hypothetical protein
MWQEVDETCHCCHSWQEPNQRTISAMTVLAAIIFGGAWAMAILGGLGVGGLGRDSRDLGERAHAQDRSWRSLLSD